MWLAVLHPPTRAHCLPTVPPARPRHQPTASRSTTPGRTACCQTGSQYPVPPLRALRSTGSPRPTAPPAQPPGPTVSRPSPRTNRRAHPPPGRVHSPRVTESLLLDRSPATTLLCLFTKTPCPPMAPHCQLTAPLSRTTGSLCRSQATRSLGRGHQSPPPGGLSSRLAPRPARRHTRSRLMPTEFPLPPW
jgi:hypothetical protein